MLESNQSALQENWEKAHATYQQHSGELAALSAKLAGMRRSDSESDLPDAKKRGQ